MRLLTANSILISVMALSAGMVDFSFGAPPTGKKTSKPVSKPSLPRNRAPTVGDKGTLHAQRAKVIQVIDANNALVEVEYVPAFIKVGNSIEADERSELVWLVRPTAGLIDGRMFNTDELFEVTGTKRYDSNAGQRTIPLIEVPDEQKDEKEGYRTWVSADGTSAIVAKFRETTGTKKDTKATLEKKDGNTVGLPTNNLSKADLKYVQEQSATGKSKTKDVP